MRFMKLHAEGRFEEMWEMLAEDAQRAWGGWTDHIHARTYDSVARLVMRYRVRQQWKEWSFDRQVHLVAADGGWRTLCYPMRAGAAAGR